jgi:hypothetical protein
MPKTKENMAAAQQLVKDILSEHFNQKVDSKSLKAAAEKIVATIPNPRAKTAA